MNYSEELKVNSEVLEIKSDATQIINEIIDDKKQTKLQIKNKQNEQICM